MRILGTSLGFLLSDVLELGYLFSPLFIGEFVRIDAQVVLQNGIQIADPVGFGTSIRIR